MNIFFWPYAIPPVFQLQHSVLRDVGGIGDRRAVRICNDGVGIAAGLLADPLARGRNT